MFDKQIRIYGKHADIIRKYSKDKQGADEQHFLVDDNEGNSKNIYLFENILQCYMCAAMIGIISRKKADVDTNRDKTANIFADILIKNRANLLRIYQHMILMENSEGSVDGTIKKAFSINKTNSDDEEAKVEAYVRGGLEIIDEYFSSCNSYEDVANKLMDFLDEYGVNIDE